MPAMSRVLWLVVLCCWLPGSSLAQTLPFGISLPPSLNFATSPSPIGSGARAAGKAVAIIGVADDATAASWNPGGVRYNDRRIARWFLLSAVEGQDVTRPTRHWRPDPTASTNYPSVVYPFSFPTQCRCRSQLPRLFDLPALLTLFRVTDIDGRSAWSHGKMARCLPFLQRWRCSSPSRRWRGLQYLARY
jgi:hypothetical protein